jgi:hypothetical protein
MKTRPASARPLRGEVARAVATLRTHPGLVGTKLRQRWRQRNQQTRTAPTGPPRPKIASIEGPRSSSGRSAWTIMRCSGRDESGGTSERYALVSVGEPALRLYQSRSADAAINRL